MTFGPTLPTPLDVAGRAVVHHADQRSSWLIVMAATLPRPPDAAALAAAVPLTSARLRAGTWVQGRPGSVLRASGDPLDAAPLWHPIRLGTDPPVRIVAAGARIALAAHHAAFDGRAVLALLRILAGTDPFPSFASDSIADDAGGASARVVRDAAARLVRPTDRVAQSTPGPDEEARVWRETAVDGSDVTARLAAATVAAVGEHNRRHGRPWRRVGITIGLAGAQAIGNTASYRRIDVDLHDAPDVAAVVAAALRRPSPPPAELRRAPRALRLLAPLAHRLGDSVLVSNLGRPAPSDPEDLIFFPVARGRSAVAVGAVGSTVSLRARDLSRTEAAAALDSIVAALS